MFLSLSYSLLSQADLSITGLNTATFVHRTAADSLNNYFANQLNLRVNRGVFTFGMSFVAGLPRFDDTEPIHELSPNRLQTEWQERFVHVDFETLRLRLGTLEETFGHGLVLRSTNERELNRDTRLEGFAGDFTFNNFRITGVYGATRADVYDGVNRIINKNDLAFGTDINYRPTSFLNLGASALQFRQIIGEESSQTYIDSNLWACRLEFTHDLFDLRTEFASLTRENRSNGTAFIATTNVYASRTLAFRAGYKRYDNFHHPLADLPRMNNYDELLMSFADIDFEEGFLAEMTWTPNFDNRFRINHAESWNDDRTVRHANLFAEYMRSFDSFDLTLDFEHLERKQEETQEWEKQVTSSIQFDLHEFRFPLAIKFRWMYSENQIHRTITHTNRPLLQLEFQVNDRLSIALFGEHEFTNLNDFGDYRFYLGTEISAEISNHTDVKLFVGQENGGNVCRGGVCRPVPPFEGVRLSLNTRF
jgi:hypothetical protein